MTGANAKVVTFTNTHFKAKLLLSDPTNNIAKDLSGNPIKIDANSNGEIEFSEALNVKYLDITFNPNNYFSKIYDVSGLENFTNLASFICVDNSISSLNLNALTALQYLNCSLNSMTSLNVTSNNNLTTLLCWSNGLTSLDVSNKPNLTYLNCSQNNLSALNLNNSNNITNLEFGSNHLPVLNLNHLSNLSYLECSSIRLHL